MPRRQGRYDEKLLQILGSGCGIFAEKGYHHASVRDVAAATGVSPAGLYYYFRSKEELLFLILDHSLGSLLQQVVEASAHISHPEDRLRAIIQSHMDFFCNHPAEMRLLVREWDVLTGEFRRRVTRRQTRYAALVLRTLRELRPDTPRLKLRASAMALFGMVNWMYQWYTPQGNLSLQEVGDHFSRLFLLGFLSGDDQGAGPGVNPAGKEKTTQGRAIAETESLLRGPGF